MSLNHFKLLLKLFLICISLQPAFSQVVINEVCTNNGNVIEDEDQSEPDWIELYNSGTSPVNLHNYSFTDSNSEPWFFPNITIQQQEYLIIFASGKNRTVPNLHTSFELSKQGETLQLFNASGTLADKMTTSTLHLDHSFGRKPDGVTGTEGIFDAPTPGTSNQNSDQYIGYAKDPVFSIPAGFYNGSCIVEITAENNTTLYYTEDGSLPTISSVIYSDPLIISNTKVIRVMAFSNNNNNVLPSNTISNTYLLNYDTSLPVFSISTNPDNLWDWNTGICVTGPNASTVYPYYGANFWQDWEIPAHIEFFETDGSRVFAQLSGMSIHGGSQNRTRPMKSFELSGKNKYGGESFQHRFFKEKAIDGFKHIVLRNASGDFNKAHFRDGTLHKLMIGKTNIDLGAYRPAAVFLNGSYYGILNTREKISKYYTEENHNVNEDNIDLLEEDSHIIEGDFSTFNAMHAFITGNDMSATGNFESASQMFDTESLCDYYIAETFLSNIDWPYNNIKFWRERTTDARWRYILIDLDIALGNNGWAPASFDVLGRIMGGYGDTNRHVQIFKSFLDNENFREYFINRYADLVNTLFSEENMTRHIEETRSVLVDEMSTHFDVWGNDMAGWDHEIYDIVLPHIADRPSYALDQVKTVFNLQGIVELELDVWPPDAGTITINTITPGPLPWKGNYFDGNPVTVSVHAKPGFHFVKWDSGTITVPDPSNPVFRVNPSENNKFTAWFGSSSDESQLMVYPNPAKELIEIGCMLEFPSQGRIEIINAQGQLVFARNETDLVKGGNKFELNVSALNSGVYTLHLLTESESKVARLVVL